jgi:hypothetical protein
MLRLTWSAIVIAAGMFVSTAALADGCADPPEPAGLPDTSKASEQDMVAAQLEVKRYLGAMEERLKCLETAGTKDAFNLAVNRMQIVAARFNTAVRAFRAKKA